MRLMALDLFRFFAAISVVLYHYTIRPNNDSFQQFSQFTQFGYLGVPLFFMISGFVIAHSAEQRTATSFFISRVTRLYPAFWIGLMFTWLVVFIIDGTDIPLEQVVANATMMNNYLGVTNVDGVYWSLHAEIKFYACVFLLLLVGAFNHYRIWLPVWVAMILLFLVYGQPSIIGWFISPHYSPYFISGACFYLIKENHRSRIVWVSLILSFAMCVYQAGRHVADFVFYVSPMHVWVAAIIVIIFHALFLLISMDKLSFKNRHIYIILGGITYPLYLIHNRAGKSIIDSLAVYIAEWLAVLFTILGMLVISFYIYKYMEPFGALKLKRLLQYMLLRKKQEGVVQ